MKIEATFGTGADPGEDLLSFCYGTIGAGNPRRRLQLSSCKPKRVREMSGAEDRIAYGLAQGQLLASALELLEALHQATGLVPNYANLFSLLVHLSKCLNQRRS